jgi:heme/copper-type cytochrome/quinol oxidase subunit 2
MSDYGNTPSPYGEPTPSPYGGMPPAQPPGVEPPNNHLVWAILSTILCCIPVGIVSIVFAAQVNGKWQAGDYAGAQASSQKAKTWAIVSAVLGLVSGVVSVALIGIGGAGSDF